MSTVKEEKYGISRLFILTMLLSLLGWAFETVYVYLAYGRWTNRGFLSLPLCPIYGCSIIFTYLLLGTPDNCRIQRVSEVKWGIFFYFYACFFIPTLMELWIGLFFDKVFHLRLWNYSYERYNFSGYICLKNSIIWTVLLFFFMKFLFSPLKRGIGKLSRVHSSLLSVGLAIVILFDFSLQIMKTVL